MNNLIFIPFINPVKYTESEFVDLPQYASKHMDDYPYYDTIKSYEQKRRFFQPWSLNDGIRQQLFSNVGPVALNVKNCHGRTIFSDNFIQRQEDANNPTLFRYDSDLDLSIFDPMRFYTEINFNGLYKIISEPMEILADIRETLYGEYVNKPFYEGIIFQDGFTPSIRFKGRLKYKKTSSRITAYEDDPLNSEMLDAKNFRVYTLFIACPSGIPDYFADRLARILRCNNLRIDGKYYTCIQEDLEPEEIEYYPMKGWKVEVRERFNRTGKYFSTDVNTDNEIIMMGNAESKGFIRDDEGGSFFQFLDVE